MLLPAGAMAAAVGLSVVNALDRRMALENAWGWLVNLGLFLMLIDWFRRGYGNHLFAGAFASGGALAGTSLLQAATVPGVRVAGLFGIVNLAGGYSAAQLVPSVGWGLSLRGKKRWLLIALALGQLLTVGLNQSRGALLSAGVAALVVLFPTAARRWRLGGLAIPILIVAVIVGIGAWSAQPAHASGDVLRLDLWKSAGEMFEKRPLTGVGVGLFGQVYRHITPYLGRPDADGITGAHNLYLNLAAELGGAGLAAGGALLLVGAYLLTKVHWNLAKLSVLGALVGILAHMGVDNFPTQNFALLVSLYTAYLLHEHRMRLPGLKAAGKIIALLTLGFCLVLLQFDRAQMVYERSLLSGSVEQAKQAARLDPGLMLYHLNILRQDKGMWRVRQVEFSVKSKTQLGLYALVSYGRYW
jgi:O-antigen ligase